MILEIWNQFLFVPLLNVLIWIYNNLTNQNLGWAVIYLTLLIRFLTLPFSIIAERNSYKNEQLKKELESIAKSYRHDPVLQKQEIRKNLKNKKVSAWAKVVVLVIQALVFFLLYQVFVRGVSGEKMLFYLYRWNDFPGTINVNFFGFNLAARHAIFGPILVALLLAFEIYLDFSKKKKKLDQHDLFFFLLYPGFVFLFLWWLPMVKALFFFTTMLFSIFIKYLIKEVFNFKEKKV